MVYYLLAPELRALPLPHEGRATCSSCALLPPPGEPDDERFFNPDTRCCTYHPRLPGFLVGRVLREGGFGGEAMRRRLTLPEGISANGVVPSAAWVDAYTNDPSARFGRALSLRCPYFQPEGDLSCGVWRNRGVICRTWHCRYEAGEVGLDLWQAVRRLLEHIEGRLVRHCLDHGRPPSGRATPKAIEAWFLWCAGEVDRLATGDLGPLIDDDLLTLRAELRRFHARLGGAMPDVLRPSVSDLRWLDDQRVMLLGYSMRDWVEAGKVAFSLLSRLDGVKPWRQVVAEAAADGVDVPEALVEELWRIGALRAPEDGDADLFTHLDPGDA